MHVESIAHRTHWKHKIYMTETRNRHHLAAAFVALAALLLYARTVGYEYVWDDLTYLQGFSQYRGLAGVIRSFTEPFYLYPSYYRPLAMLSFVISAEPSVQHGINVLLHAVNTALVLYVARALMPREVAQSRAGTVAAALSALLFAVHPVAVESTAWVSGRFDTLMCTFVLGTCLAALGGELTRKRLALVFVLFACAMGCKESAVGLPVALPFLLLLKWRLAGMGVAQIKGQHRSLAGLLAALALAVGLYITVRLVAIETLFANKTSGITFDGGSALDKLNVTSMAVAAFVQLIVAPMRHSAPLHPFEYETGSGVLTTTAVVMLCALVLLALVFVKKSKLNFPLALLAALAMTWPTLHLLGIPNGENIVSDRYALAPLALLLAALAATAGVWAEQKMQQPETAGQRIPLYAAVAGLLWSGMLAAYSSATIPLWRNETVFWNFAHDHAPQSLYAHRMYINTLISGNRWQEADMEINNAWKNNPGHLAKLQVEDVANWALIRSRVGNYAGALELFSLVDTLGENKLKLMQPRVLGHFYGIRGAIEYDAGHMDQAVQFFEKAVQISPENLSMSFLYAQALHMIGQTERSDDVFARTIVQVNNEMAAREKQKREIWRRQTPVAGAVLPSPLNLEK